MAMAVVACVTSIWKVDNMHEFSTGYHKPPSLFNLILPVSRHVTIVWPLASPKSDV